MEGFIVFDYAKQYSQARKELSQWLSEGKIQRKETIVKGGLAKAENALIDLYNGINTGRYQVPTSWPVQRSKHLLTECRQIARRGQPRRQRCESQPMNVLS